MPSKRFLEDEELRDDRAPSGGRVRRLIMDMLPH
jgi:hypothetical protein